MSFDQLITLLFLFINKFNGIYHLLFRSKKCPHGFAIKLHCSSLFKDMVWESLLDPASAGGLHIWRTDRNVKKIFVKCLVFKQHFLIKFQILVIFPIFVIESGNKNPHFTNPVYFKHCIPFWYYPHTLPYSKQKLLIKLDRQFWSPELPPKSQIHFHV